ncbi:MAG: NAD(P)/FAD-dependent oxidoreductase [Anaerolineaceae bacterium]|nr:NAD(P)/FAD-dependent oxidoreductase [Anaerolineaceae bacterium]
MIETDVLIVGGGPAGSSCARKLKEKGMACIVLDQVAFPRFKPCAGWITPEVIRDLQLDLAEYPHGLTSFSKFNVAVGALQFKMPTRQYAIRRIEFDAWLLQRAGVAFHIHKVKEIQEENGRYVVDGEYSARYLVGAGGTHCPVYQTLFKPANPKIKSALIVAQEDEFEYKYADERCHLWFFQNHLPGYAWYVPKANGVVNVGVGGKAESLKSKGDSLKNHWNFLVKKLEESGLVQGYDFKPSGHSYYLRQPLGQTRKGNALLAGDALGLATLDMGEGIGPAIRSGMLAAEAILSGAEYTLGSIPRYSMPSLLRLRG